MTDSSSQDVNFVFMTMITCVATIGGFLFGFDSGVINGTVDGLREAFNSDSVGTGFNVASMLLGCAIGAFFAGRLADTFGRRALMLVAATFFLLSAWGSGIAASSLEFVVYRVLGGLAVGAASVMAPAYISEIAPAKYRGRLVSLQQIAIIAGLFVAFVSNYVIAKTAGSSVVEFWYGYEAWRWMFWIEVLPAGVYFLALLFVPESPRFLVMRGREEQAHKALTRLLGMDAAKAKVLEINESLHNDHRKPRFSDILVPGTKRVRRVIWVGIGLAVFQQLVGINVVFYYGAVLWQSVGFSESDALLINVLTGGVSIVACVATVLLIDKLGRKPLLRAGSIGMAAALGLMAYMFSGATLDDSGQLVMSETSGLIALIAANAYVFLFNVSWGPVMWVALGEMFPNKIRGSGLAVAGLFQWGANFMITMTFPLLLTGIGLAGAYGIYALCSVLSVVFVSTMFIETNGVELEDMDNIAVPGTP